MTRLFGAGQIIDTQNIIRELGTNLVKSGGFDPIQLLPEIYYSLGKQTGFVDNDPIGTLTDFSGKGRNAIQLTTANKPTFKITAGVLPSGKPTAFFTTDDLMVAVPPTFTQPNYLLIVWKPTNTGGGPIMIDGGPTGLGRHVVNPDFSGNNLFYFSGTNQSYVWSNTNWQISEVAYNGSSSNAWENNVQKLTNVNMGAQSLIGLTLGARFSAANFVTAYLYALVFLNRIPSATERTNLYNFFHADTGI